jgi:hypothetical protein
MEIIRLSNKSLQYFNNEKLLECVTQNFNHLEALGFTKTQLVISTEHENSILRYTMQTEFTDPFILSLSKLASISPYLGY